MSRWDTMVAEGPESAAIAIAFLSMHFLETVADVVIPEEARRSVMWTLQQEIKEWLDGEMQDGGDLDG